MIHPTNKLLAFPLALSWMLGTSAFGATLWVDGVLSVPTTHIAADTSDLTDENKATGWTGIELVGDETLTLGWSTPFLNDGTGEITVTSVFNSHPMVSGTGFDVRFLLADDSYSDSYTVAANTSKYVFGKAILSDHTFKITDVYSGPLAIKGIEFTNPNPSLVGGELVYSPFNMSGVRAIVPVPEASSSLVAALGVILLAGRRRR